MFNQVSKSQFKAKALEYFREVESSGQTVVITDHGQPTLEIRRFQSPSRSPLDVLRGSVLRYDRPLDPVGSDEWEAAR